MDALQAIGAQGGNNTYPVADPGSSPAPPAPGANSAQSANAPAPAAFSPQINASPSPTPEAIAAGTKGLPANVRYAPSAAPHDGGGAKFDRSA